MIHVNRPGRVPAPFLSPEMENAKKERNKFYKDVDELRPQLLLRQKFTDPPENIRRQIDEILYDLFNGKCAYCERPVGKDSSAGIDHFRPLFEARGAKEFSVYHYWWLSYEWKNMYLCCNVCGKYKSSWFPVDGRRARLGAPWSEIRKEKNLLIDPCEDHPSLHFAYLRSGFIKPIDKKGETTIEYLKLNRSELVIQRRKAAEEMIHSVELLNKLFRSPVSRKKRQFESQLSIVLGLLTDTYLAQSKLPFLGVRRFWIKEKLKQREFGQLIMDKTTIYTVTTRELQTKVDALFAEPSYQRLVTEFGITPVKTQTSSKKIKEKIAYKQDPSIVKRVFINRIEIENFKAIRRLSVKFPEFNQSDQGWMMLLGENGAGKSTFLEALAIAMSGQNYLKNFLLKPREILSHGANKGFIRVYLVGEEQPITIKIDHRLNRITSSLKTSRTWLLAYGSTRLPPGGKGVQPEASTGKVRAKNLMYPNVALIDSKKWMLSLKEEKFQLVARALGRVLLLRGNDHITREKRTILVNYQNGSRATLEELSDGYQSVVALTVDIMEKLMNDPTSAEAAEGIVLIDEIGTHLHPRWKMRIVKTLREIFKKVQVITTTHDPLCLKGMREHEVIVFKKDSAGNALVRSDLPDPSTFTADQLLASEFFGLYSTLDPEVEDAFDNYYRLLGKHELSSEEQIQLQELKKKLKDKDQLGSSLREELMYEAIDNYIVKKEDPLVNEDQIKLKDETMRRLQQILDHPTFENDKP